MSYMKNSNGEQHPAVKVDNTYRRRTTGNRFGIFAVCAGLTAALVAGVGGFNSLVLLRNDGYERTFSYENINGRVISNKTGNKIVLSSEEGFFASGTDDWPVDNKVGDGNFDKLNKTGVPEGHPLEELCTFEKMDALWNKFGPEE